MTSPPGFIHLHTHSAYSLAEGAIPVEQLVALCQDNNMPAVALTPEELRSISAYLASLKELGQAYREILGAHYPAMALVQVVRLVEKDARVEIEATAVVPR